MALAWPCTDALAVLSTLSLTLCTGPALLPAHLLSASKGGLPSSSS